MSSNEEYFNGKEFRSLLKEYEMAVANGDITYFDADDLADIAEYYHDKGNKNAALKAIDLALEMYPGEAVPLSVRARMALFDDCDIDAAWNYAEQITNKDDLEYTFLVAELYLNENREDDADRLFEEKMRTVGDDEREDSYIDIANMFVDYVYIELGEKWLSRSTLTEEPDYLDLKGRIALAKGDYKVSEKIFKSLLDEDPFSSGYWNSLASSQLMHNDAAGAIDSCDFSIALNPNNPDGLLNKGHALFNLKNYKEALKYYTRYYKLKGSDECGPMSIGLTLMHMGRYSTALPWLKKAYALSNANGDNDCACEMLSNIVFACTELHRYNEAMKYISMLQKQPNCDKGKAWVMKGTLLLDRGCTEEAEECFKRALRETDLTDETIYQIAAARYDCGQASQAYDMLHDMFSPDSGWTCGYGLYALCCHAVGERDEFLRALKMVCECDPDEAKLMLSSLFPPELEPSEYYDYALSEQGTF